MMFAGDITLDPGVLGQLLPMHLRTELSGRVLSMGATFARIAGSRATPDMWLFDLLACELPDGEVEVAPLVGAPVVRLRFRDGRRVGFRGHAVALPDGTALFDLAFDLVDLADLGGARLTASDFPPTDRTLDMLYLMEAKSLAMREALRLVDRLQDARDRAEAAALTDTLTGLQNRRGLDHVLQRTSLGTPFSICQVDLDHFKRVNDSYGHAAGDAVLRAVARRLMRNVRTSDTVARVGGDEFLIILPELTDIAVLDEIALRIVAELERPVVHGGQQCRISASLGIAVSTDYGYPDVKLMIADADAALYRSKSGGRARHTIHARPEQAPAPPGPPGTSRRSARP
ncbi:diguanylate cyclase (GGDEF) domain-containing protein [Palleronia marisminoris]|uniref:Diguanylate cyclase DosC n=1 Tax=Palleronia marisminoris TaxID=315423 RepID=A0A1Y5T6X8_9RHOB|nr:GGDEF domain-containing protein [Palleronia marisminoris]SFH21193.1 diguanylate cyclase (GGDEF) domain-containing protein [Palleronia marisminoris]SLN57258.1 Diguanylate cyclase DosC [Palleronia marisminoris]